MKKLIVLALVLGLLLAMVTPVAAGGNRLNGKIININKDAQHVTIRVISGSDYVGDEILIQVTHKTSLYECDDGEQTEIEFGDLKIDNRVGVTGKFVGDILYAKVIVVH